jgi:hemerythrin-like domain-containing protein
MRPTEMLVNEHGVIRQALDSMSLALEKLENGERPPTKFFEKAVEFARAFSDKFHHHKEEYLMFGRLAQKKKGKLDAQIDSLRYQHERGRGIINEIEHSLSAYSEGEDATTIILMENVAAYTALLRHHIHREDHVFYPMVDKELSEGDQQYLLNEFKKEDAKTGGKSLDNGRKLAAEMGSLL